MAIFSKYKKVCFHNKLKYIVNIQFILDYIKYNCLLFNTHTPSY